MHTLDRNTQPAYHPIEKIDILKAVQHQLKNDVPLHIINEGTQDVIRIDFYFTAGSWYQEKPLIAMATNAMLNEGTKNLTSAQIAEKLDFYGAFLQPHAEKHTACISLYTLKKHFPKTIEIVEDIIKNSIFPEKEFDTYIQKRKQQFIVDDTKVEVLARRKFNEILFGSNHPYGQAADLEDFDNLTTEELICFHKKLYAASNCEIIISGKVDDKDIELVDNHFGGNDWNRPTIFEKKTFEIDSSEQKNHIVLKDDAVQSAIRMGKVLFNKLHPDFMGMQILNTIFGGYFGSRLMTNIREDKGYTYGIGSGIISLRDSGYLTIASEVGVDVCKDAVKEIYVEMAKLRDELIPEEELSRVKNYILGQMLHKFDGPFSLADSFWSIHEYHLDYSYFDKYIKTVREITAEDLNKLANKYLKQESILEAIAGKY